MSRSYFSPGQLTWDELMDIRKEALRSACIVYQGNGDRSTEEYFVLAKAFEEYLKGKK